MPTFEGARADREALERDPSRAKGTLDSARVHGGLSEPARQKLEIAESFVRCYVASQEGLETLGILRSKRPLQVDFSEWLAAQLLGLQLATTGVQKGYDATDLDGRKYQVKARFVKTLGESSSWDFKKRKDGETEYDFDFLVGVFLSHSFEVMGIVKVPRAVVQEVWTDTESSFRFRWNRKIAEDPRVERLVWPEQSA